MSYNNKVISFSLYGNKDLYCLGMIENVDIINSKYSDWKIHIYYSDIPENIFKILKSKDNTTLIKCQYHGYAWEGMFWRFQPFNSNTIDIFLSRDADSRITHREMKLVNQFIESDKCVHVIRDHNYHMNGIMGGTFAIKVKELQKYKKFKDINFYIKDFQKIYNRNIAKQPDQAFLNKELFRKIKKHKLHLTHISDESVRFTPDDILIDKAPNDDFIGKRIYPKIKIEDICNESKDRFLFNDN